MEPPRIGHCRKYPLPETSIIFACSLKDVRNATKRVVLSNVILATYQCTDNRHLLFAFGVKKAVTRSRCWISPQISLELWNETQPKWWNINLYRSREQTTKFVPVTGLIWWGLSAIRKQINRSHSRASQLQWRTHSAGTDWISGAFCSPPKHFVGY